MIDPRDIDFRRLALPLALAVLSSLGAAALVAGMTWLIVRIFSFH